MWLNRNQIALLFDRDIKTIGKHINNALKEELSSEAVDAKFATTASDNKKYSVEYYNLDMIISIGYRVKSQNGVIFRKRATSILKDYMIKGYAINQKRMEALNKTVAIQTRMLASVLDIEESDVLKTINLYTEGLSLLDDFDHQCIEKPKGNASIYHLSYVGCRKIIDEMAKTINTEVFGVEKEKGKLEGIIASIY